jgi:hypothetical protein
MKWSHDCCLSGRTPLRVPRHGSLVPTVSPQSLIEDLVAERFRERHPPAYLEDDCA